MNIEQKTITSVEVAEMMGIDHWKVLRKLEGTEKVKGIIPTLTDNKIVVSDYFTESTYRDNSGKENRCYAVTKIGCDFLANKYTGEKGILFTAKYVKRFREMEEVITSTVRPLTEREMMRVQLEMIDDVTDRVERLENNTTIDYGQQKVLERLVNMTVVAALGGKSTPAYKSIGKKVFKECNRDIQDRFDVNSRSNVPKLRYDEACTYIKNWLPCTNTRALIQDTNNQLDIDDIA